MANQRKKRVLVLGMVSSPWKDGEIEIVFLPWDRFPASINPADFDFLILSLDAFRSDIGGEVFAHIMESLTFKVLYNIIKQRDCEIIYLGDPSKGRGASNWIPSLAAGLYCTMDRRGGTQMNVGSWAGLWEDYCLKLDRWDYSFKTIQSVQADVGELVSNRKPRVEAAIYPILLNRYEQPVACGICHVVESGPSINGILFLPYVTKESDDSVKLVLFYKFGITLQSSEPGWLTEIVAPGQTGIDNDIYTARADLDLLNSRLTQLQIDRAKSREILRLLYGGDAELEIVVLETFQLLGAIVEFPLEKGKEDGWISVKTSRYEHMGVLEVKSAKGKSFNEDGRRQLNDWIYRGKTIRHIEYKGIFIGNSQKDDPLEERIDPFSDSWRKAAKLLRISAIRTDQIYDAYCAMMDGNFDHDGFWDTLFLTDGVIDSVPCKIQIR